MAKHRTSLITLSVIVILAGLGYWQRARVRDFWERTVRQKWHALAPATPSSVWTPAPGPGISHIPPPSVSGEKQHAAPGTFYMTERVKVISRVGIQAVNPGELVKLLERRPDGKLKVTIDHADFVVSPKQVTDDLDVARDAERKFQQQPPANL